MENNALLPRLRKDLVYDEIEIEGQTFITLYDLQGYAQQPVELPVTIFPLLQILDGSLTPEKLRNMLVAELGNQVDFVLEQFLSLLCSLDFLGYMESPRFYLIKNEFDSYMLSPVRNPICAGQTYSEEPELLASELDEIMELYSSKNYHQEPKALIIPHIDFRIGIESHLAYSAAYNALKNSDAELFVIFGTAHYGNTSLFMLTEKDFSTPYGILETDKEILEYLKRELGNKIRFDDRTHRNEHSIELQTIMLKHIFRDRKIKILPILVGSFQHFINQKSLPKTSKFFNDFIDTLKAAINYKKIKTCYIASADLAHIGRKFGDSFDAELALENLRDEDTSLINSLLSINPDEFFTKVSDVNDKRRICGLSPIYTMLKMDDYQSSEYLEYQQWNEQETKSAVSFGSIAFY